MSSEALLRCALSQAARETTWSVVLHNIKSAPMGCYPDSPGQSRPLSPRRTEEHLHLTQLPPHLPRRPPEPRRADRRVPRRAPSPMTAESAACCAPGGAAGPAPGRVAVAAVGAHGRRWLLAALAGRERRARGTRDVARSGGYERGPSSCLDCGWLTKKAGGGYEVRVRFGEGPAGSARWCAR